MLNKLIRLFASANQRLHITRWIPAPLLQRWRGRALRRLVANLPDRIFLEQRILTCFADQPWNKILFVGCESFTQHYGQRFASGPIEYWTIDVKPASAIWGEPGRHLTCDVRELDRHFPARNFDAVVLNGVFGFGVNDAADMETTVRAIHKVLVPGGVFLLGWNRELMPDPSSLVALQEWFEHGSSLPLPSRQSFSEVTHIYDLFTARKAAGQSSSGSG